MVQIARGRVLHLSAHSFVPVLDGETRDAPTSALLYDPRAVGTKPLCAMTWLAALDAALPTLAIRRNSSVSR